MYGRESTCKLRHESDKSRSLKQQRGWCTYKHLNLRCGEAIISGFYRTIWDIRLLPFVWSLIRFLSVKTTWFLSQGILTYNEYFINGKYFFQSEEGKQIFYSQIYMLEFFFTEEGFCNTEVGLSNRCNVLGVIYLSWVQIYWYATRLEVLSDWMFYYWTFCRVSNFVVFI